MEDHRLISCKFHRRGGLPHGELVITSTRDVQSLFIFRPTEVLITQIGTFGNCSEEQLPAWMFRSIFMNLERANIELFERIVNW